VYQFYLEEVYSDQENPILRVREIKGAKKFYEELTNNFVIFEKDDVKRKVLKTLILLYKDFNMKIKDSSFIGILLKTLRGDNKRLIYLIL